MSAAKGSGSRERKGPAVPEDTDASMSVDFTVLSNTPSKCLMIGTSPAPRVYNPELIVFQTPKPTPFGNTYAIFYERIAADRLVRHKTPWLHLGRGAKATEFKNTTAKGKEKITVKEDIHLILEGPKFQPDYEKLKEVPCFGKELNLVADYKEALRATDRFFISWAIKSGILGDVPDQRYHSAYKPLAPMDSDSIFIKLAKTFGITETKVWDCFGRSATFEDIAPDSNARISLTITGIYVSNASAGREASYGPTWEVNHIQLPPIGYTEKDMAFEAALLECPF
jgi:hypothetical protein